MKSYDESRINEILSNNHRVAVIGISDKPERDSYRVADYLMKNGYEIVPVNPKLEEWNGIKSYPSLEAVPGDVDIVDVFRKPETVRPVAEEAVRKRAPVLWLQEGVINEEAADYAKEHGMAVVMDRCMMKEHSVRKK